MKTRIFIYYTDGTSDASDMNSDEVKDFIDALTACKSTGGDSIVIVGDDRYLWINLTHVTRIATGKAA